MLTNRSRKSALVELLGGGNRRREEADINEVKDHARMRQGRATGRHRVVMLTADDDDGCVIFYPIIETMMKTCCSKGNY